TKNPEVEKPIARQRYQEREKHISQTYNEQDVATTAIEADPSLRDFYNRYDPFSITPADQQAYDSFVAGLDAKERKLVESGKHFYEISLSNVGGLITPVILGWTYEDGSTEIERIPAEIWRYNSETVTKVFAKDKKVAQIVVDPYRETADTDETNNYFPKQNIPTRFEVFKQKQRTRGTSGPNPMQQQRGRSNSNVGNE
ncbi:MAG: M1 family peptidase, partial [Bacteroidota bacterium]